MNVERTRDSRKENQGSAFWVLEYERLVYIKGFRVIRLDNL